MPAPGAMKPEVPVNAIPPAPPHKKNGVLQALCLTSAFKEKNRIITPQVVGVGHDQLCALGHSRASQAEAAYKTLLTKLQGKPEHIEDKHISGEGYLRFFFFFISTCV